MTKLGKDGRKINPKSLANLKGGHQWKPGQSGNPSGKSKSHYDLVKKAKAAGPKAFKTILEVMENPKAPAALRVKCAIELLDRGYGRPVNPQHLRVEGNVNHGQAHLAALRLVNEEARRERIAKQKNGDKAIEKPGYLIDTSADEAKDITPK